MLQTLFAGSFPSATGKVGPEQPPQQLSTYTIRGNTLGNNNMVVIDSIITEKTTSGNASGKTIYHYVGSQLIHSETLGAGPVHQWSRTLIFTRNSTQLVYVAFWVNLQGTGGNLGDLSRGLNAFRGALFTLNLDSTLNIAYLELMRPRPNSSAAIAQTSYMSVKLITTPP